MLNGKHFLLISRLYIRGLLKAKHVQYIVLLILSSFVTIYTTISRSIANTKKNYFLKTLNTVKPQGSKNILEQYGIVGLKLCETHKRANIKYCEKCTHHLIEEVTAAKTHVSGHYLQKIFVPTIEVQYITITGYHPEIYPLMNKRLTPFIYTFMIVIPFLTIITVMNNILKQYLEQTEISRYLAVEIRNDNFIIYNFICSIVASSLLCIVYFYLIRVTVGVIFANQYRVITQKILPAPLYQLFLETYLPAQKAKDWGILWLFISSFVIIDHLFSKKDRYRRCYQLLQFIFIWLSFIHNSNKQSVIPLIDPFEKLVSTYETNLKNVYEQYLLKLSNFKVPCIIVKTLPNNLFYLITTITSIFLTYIYLINSKRYYET